MAAQPAEIIGYQIEDKNRFVLTGPRCPGDRGRTDLAVFRSRDAGERALLLACKSAELGEQHGLMVINRYFLQAVTTTRGESLENAGRSYRDLAEFARLADAEKARDALNATLPGPVKAPEIFAATFKI